MPPLKDSSIPRLYRETQKVEQKRQKEGRTIDMDGQGSPWSLLNGGRVIVTVIAQSTLLEAQRWHRGGTREAEASSTLKDSALQQMAFIALQPWASCQLPKILGCACARHAGNVFPYTAGWRSWHASRHVRDARAVMHAGIANKRFPLKSVAGKRSRHSRRMPNPLFCVSGKRPIGRPLASILQPRGCQRVPSDPFELPLSI